MLTKRTDAAVYEALSLAHYYAMRESSKPIRWSYGGGGGVTVLVMSISVYIYRRHRPWVQLSTAVASFLRPLKNGYNHFTI